MARKFTIKQFDKIENMLKEYTFKQDMIIQDIRTLDEYYGLKGVNYDKVIINPTNKFNSDVENQMMSKVSIENRLSDNKEFIRRLDSALSMLSAEDKQIIEEYYIKDTGWFSVERRMNSSKRRCQRKRDLAIIRIYEVLYGEKVDKKTGNTQLSLEIMK